MDILYQNLYQNQDSEDGVVLALTSLPGSVFFFFWPLLLRSVFFAVDGRSPKEKLRTALALRKKQHQPVRALEG